MTPGERILEIGCGLALASLVGHRRGADVTASDRHPLAAAFLAENLRLNGLVPMKYLHGDWDAPSAPAAAGAPAVGAQRFDLIIGSDLLYERDASGALAGFVSRHAKESCEVWIVDPDRSNRPAFNRLHGRRRLRPRRGTPRRRRQRDERGVQGTPARLPP